MQWIDQYSSRRFRIVTAGYPNERTALVKTYGDVLREYEFHSESKCADPKGDACDKQTVGLLKRLHVRILKTTYIGKESNKIEEVASALVHSAQEVYAEYPDPRRDDWETKIRPALNRVEPERIAKMTGLSLRTLIICANGGRRRPHPKNQEWIAAEGATSRQLAHVRSENARRNPEIFRSNAGLVAGGRGTLLPKILHHHNLELCVIHL